MRWNSPLPGGPGAALLLAALSACSLHPRTPDAASRPSRLELRPCRVPDVDEELRCGTHDVPENRRLDGGRTLPLRVIVIPARAERPEKEPVFILAGGPGQAATGFAPFLVGSWERQHHPVVLVDQRGTGEGHRLDCPLGGSDDAPQGYLEPLFSDSSTFRACREELEKRADLTQYTTPIAMQDLDEVRQALGYERIHLEGGSYGTRAALTYLRMYGQHVKSALLSGLVPMANRGPLFHAAAAQRAFEELVAECEAEAPCRAAHPHLREDLAAILQGLRDRPARVRVSHPVTGAATELLLSEGAFAEALRMMMYSVESGRSVPLLLQRARAGDFTPFAQTALQGSRGLRSSLRFGLMLSVTCDEDVARIHPEEVERETAGSFLGSQRVRGQLAACAEWPRATLPEEHFRPFRSEVPVVLLSGRLDPVTPPSWAEEARRSLPRSVHLVTPGAHVTMNECIASIGARLFRSASVQGLDTRCVGALRNPPFVLSADTAR
jgi:pimeloyl-ACP methyl ester carboxylesterase